MAKETFYKYSNGKKVILTSSEVKQYIMRANNWTAEQYRKQYDIFKNKLRAYESYKQAQGATEKPQSVVSVLFKEAKAKRQYGKDYIPSQKMQQIRSFSAYSITKGRQLTTQQNYLTRQRSKYKSYVDTRFGDFIKKNKGAEQIVQAFEEHAKETGLPINYVEMERALSDYANNVNAKIDEQDKVQDNEAIQYGETYGSDIEIDFDISSYL